LLLLQNSTTFPHYPCDCSYDRNNGQIYHPATQNQPRSTFHPRVHIGISIQLSGTYDPSRGTALTALPSQHSSLTPPQLASRVLTFITSIFAHFTPGHMATPLTLKLWRMPGWALFLNCLVLGVSFLSISLNVLVDGLSVSVSLLSIFGALGAGYLLTLLCYNMF
jgi:hypothetical protein